MPSVLNPRPRFRATARGAGPNRSLLLLLLRGDAGSPGRATGGGARRSGPLDFPCSRPVERSPWMSQKCG